MSFFNYTIEDVKRVREQRECSLVEAKEILEGRILLQTTADATQVYHLKPILEELIRKLYQQ